MRLFTSVNAHNGSDVIPHTIVADLKQRIALHGVREVREGIARTIRAELGEGGGPSADWRAEHIVQRIQSLAVFPDGAGLLLAVPFLLVANGRPADGYGYPAIPGRLPLSGHRELAGLLSAGLGRSDVEMRVRRSAIAPQAVWRALEQGTTTAVGMRAPNHANGDNFIHTGGCGGGGTIAVRLVLVEARLHGARAMDRLQQLFGADDTASAVDWQGLLTWGRSEFGRLGLCDLLPVYGPAGKALAEVANYLNTMTLDLLADAAGLACKKPPRLAVARSCEKNWSRGSARLRSGVREEVRVAACVDHEEQAVARLCLWGGVTADDIDRALASHADRYQPIHCDLPVSGSAMRGRANLRNASRMAGGP